VRFIRKFCTDARGGTAIEYGFVLALIVIAMFASLSTFAGHVISLLTNVSMKFAQVT
jgi:pilus assembly protein Flp/PilA